MHITIAAERLFSFFGLNVTNTVLTAFIVIAIIVGFILWFNRRLSYENPGRLQILFEFIISYLGDMVFELLGEERGKKILGFLFTFLMFILVSNWFGLLPIVPTLAVDKAALGHGGDPQEINLLEPQPTHEGNAVSDNTLAAAPEGLSLGTCLKAHDCYITTAGVKQFAEPVHVLRAPTTDLSMTVALAIMSVFMTNFLGFAVLKHKYLGKFISFKNPVSFFVGILELLSEFIRVISFSFRLFGNIFAGELLLTVITFLSFGLGTLPFLFLEIFVGVIQALVFFILTAMFMSLAIKEPH